jgi:hypothetical protein
MEVSNATREPSGNVTSIRLIRCCIKIAVHAARAAAAAQAPVVKPDRKVLPICRGSKSLQLKKKKAASRRERLLPC